MKVQITRKDSGIEVRECGSWAVENSCLILVEHHAPIPYECVEVGVSSSYNTTQYLPERKAVCYACTDWLECEVVDEA